jgi:hypothetical protein
MKRTFTLMAVCANFLVNDVWASGPGYGSPGPAGAGHGFTTPQRLTGPAHGTTGHVEVNKVYQTHIQNLIDEEKFEDAARAIATGKDVPGGIRHSPPIQNDEKEFILTKILEVVWGMKRPGDKYSEQLGQKALESFLHPFMFDEEIFTEKTLSAKANWAHAFVCAAIASAAAHQFTTDGTGKDNGHLYDRFLRYIKGGKAGFFSRRTVAPKKVIETRGDFSIEKEFVDVFREKTGQTFDNFLANYNIKGLFDSYWNIVREKNLVKDLVDAAKKRAIISRWPTSSGMGRGTRGTMPGGGSPKA